jgi:predicted  nucleic acid-binding Zn-ribbon protein
LITEVAQECPPGPMQSHLNNLTLKHVNESLDSLSQLEQALVKLYSHRNLNREMHRTCREIEKLSAELLEASDKRATLLRRLLKSKRDYVTVLEEIHEFQSQAELEIRKIASDLITTHAEMLLIITRGDFNPNRLKRFDENIQEHLTSLRDMVAVMDELGYSRAAS